MSTTSPHPNGSSHGSRLINVAVVMALLASFAIVAATEKDLEATPQNAEDNVGRPISDTWITTQVKTEILTHSALKAFEIRVRTEEGVVFLQGKLPSQEAVDLVTTIAVKVKGVRGVDTSAIVVS